MPERIFGKEYNTVQERISQIQSNGLDNATASITTEIEKHWAGNSGLNEVIVKATVTYEGLVFTGYAHEREAAYQEGKGERQQSINWLSYLENAETSAVGRALGMAGLGGIAVASADEMFATVKQENDLLKERLENAKSVYAEQKAEIRRLQDDLERAEIQRIAHADDETAKGGTEHDSDSETS